MNFDLNNETLANSAIEGRFNYNEHAMKNPGFELIRPEGVNPCYRNTFKEDT